MRARRATASSRPKSRDAPATQSWQAAGEGPRILGTVSGKVGLSTICTVSARESEEACQSKVLADDSKTLPAPAA